MEKFKTGGGTFTPSVDSIDAKVLSLLGNRATPLPNPFDSDAAYNSECMPFARLISTVCMPMFDGFRVSRHCCCVTSVASVWLSSFSCPPSWDWTTRMNLRLNMYLAPAINILISVLFHDCRILSKLCSAQILNFILAWLHFCEIVNQCF